MTRPAKKTSTAILFYSLAALTAACVTVNVNFPESAVQKATDDYVRDLYRAKERGSRSGGASHESSPSPAGDAAPVTPGKAGKPTTWLSIPSLVATAQAADDFKVSSPKALQIRDKLAALLDEVLAQKRAGALGETNEGFVSVRGGPELKPLLKKRIEKVADDENALRKSLYDEVLSSNGISRSRIKEIQKSFSRSFQSESPSGTWIQDGDGNWSQKP